MAEAFIYTAQASGTADTLNLYLDSSSTATRVIVGVYADSSGKPGALLASGTLDNPTAGGWNAFKLSAFNITSGTRYWIAILTPVGYGTIQFRDLASGGGATVTTTQSNLTALPASFSVGGTWANSPMSAYLSSSASATTPAPAPVAAASLSWVPSTNTSVTGYRVYYGTAPGSYSQALGSGVSVGNVTSTTISALQTGFTYYFAVTAVDAAGNESPYSNEASKLIQ